MRDTNYCAEYFKSQNEWNHVVRIKTSSFETLSEEFLQKSFLEKEGRSFLKVYNNRLHTMMVGEEELEQTEEEVEERRRAEQEDSLAKKIKEDRFLLIVLMKVHPLYFFHPSSVYIFLLICSLFVIGNDVRYCRQYVG